MLPSTDIRHCKNCGCELAICILVIDGEFYCCDDCYHRVPCRCGEIMEQEDYCQGTQSSSIFVE